MIILLNRCGQLGNRLFMFGNFIALAHKHNLKIMNLAFFEYQRHFKHISNDLFCRYPQKKFKFIKHREVNYLFYLLCFYFFKFLRKFNPFKKRLLIVDLDKDHLTISPHNCSGDLLETARKGLVVVLHGWVDTFTQLNHSQAEVIRKYFEIKDEHKKNIAPLINHARDQGQVLVGVHIRHGDYRRFRGGKYFYSIDEYTDLMKRFEQLMPAKQIIFLICSNEPTEQSQFKGLKTIIGSGHRAEDMYALAQCDFLMGPPSTYTMWASFYGQVPLYIVEDTKNNFDLSNFSIFCSEKNE